MLKLNNDSNNITDSKHNKEPRAMFESLFVKMSSLLFTSTELIFKNYVI
jgi:hypothetical protein